VDWRYSCSYWHSWDRHLRAPGRERSERGTNGNDILYSTEGRDILFGLAGNDVLSGGGGDDVFYDGPGNDEIYGGDGFDRLYTCPDFDYETIQDVERVIEGSC